VDAPKAPASPDARRTRRPSPTPLSTKLSICDLRTNKHFTLKEWSSSDIDWRSVSPKGQRCSADQSPLKRADLDDFVACYNPKNRHERKESERFKSFTYEELTKRDKRSIPSHVPGFPRHAQSLGASRRKAGTLPALTSTSFASKTKASKTAPILLD
jgi:hypothetical protein